ncbi:Fcf2 pre-rRNA processing [Penicillium taxi]|uniref:Fcf2 pre-rRNA processing n=1 Tax=Penicillium taxi TaxID=168475 RepID=UPI00254547FC|nr:Fcf2 pre-rRNA processing [Penicillium taxi]KAJ5902484.1 Fcf2 pre-rRNA processing [Penicillium taxi]
MSDLTDQPQVEEDLNDDQIQQLLLEAEARLRPNGQISQGLDVASLKIPKLSSGSSLEPYIRQQNDIAVVDSTQLVDPKEKKLANSLRSTQAITAKKPSTDKATAGPEWFNMPKTVMTTELKRDLQLIRMRNVLDPKRHYKKENGKAKAPEFSQIGTIIQGPTEFFSNRIVKKDRKKNFVEETMATERQTGRFKSKYRDIQATKTSGKKAYYNNLQAKRNKK